MRSMHLCALLVGLLGVAAVYYAYWEGNRVTPIANVNASMDGDVVRVAGTVVDVEYDDRYEKTAFTVVDDTGTITVFGWSEFTSSMLAAGTMPGLGDDVVVEGVVDVYEGSSGAVVSVEVSRFSSVEVVYRPVEVKLPGQVYASDVGKKVSVTGNVTDRHVGYSGSEVRYVFLTLTDQSGSLNVYVSGDLVALAGSAAVFPNVTQTVQVTGLVTEYEGEVELAPSNATSSAIRILPGVGG